MTVRLRATQAPASAKTAGLLERKCACGTHVSGGECRECKRRRLQRRPLSIGVVNDPLETEAERAAEAVMARGQGTANAFAPLQLSRVPLAGGDADGAAPGLVEQVLAGPGHALDAATLAFMEPRFGSDFSHVGVHDDARAQASARAVAAAAYTVGSHIVLGAGQPQPQTAAGQRLLAHELAHVLQQRGSRTPVLRRQPAGSAGAPAWIREVRVRQVAPQGVVATLSDGSSFNGICSTGKGHCCFDASAGAAAGGACSETRSRQAGSNCTPLGTFMVTRKIRSGPTTPDFWTQFHDARSVALHEYTPVNGQPLSHGCVRLQRATAERIFDGSVTGRTQVVVEGLAQPKCSDSALQNEWRGDFATAGRTPPDGETIQRFSDRRLSPREIRAEQARALRHIRQERRALRSALGVDDAGLDAEVAAVAGGTPVVSRIPRCVPARTQEEAQLPQAQGAGFLDAAASRTAARFRRALGRTGNTAQAERVTRTFGEQLWQDAATAARGGGAGSDDRQLYWTRLMLSAALRDWDPGWVRNVDTLRRLHAELLQLLEQTSRGMTGAAFGTDADVKRILVSGFDPFGFTSGDIRQSNSSGAAALALDGETLSDGGNRAQVQSVVYPVRYADFNEGVVENFLRPHLSGVNPPQLVMSISQGGSRFELEEYAGRRRSTVGFRDNLGQLSGGSPTHPIVPPGLAAGPEFMRTNVSDATLRSMRGALGRRAALREETEVRDLPAGAAGPRTSASGPPANAGQAVEGSGGGFLSNEVFYRNSLLIARSGARVPTIHLHTPRLAPTAGASQRNALIDAIRRILRAALARI